MLAMFAVPAIIDCNLSIARPIGQCLPILPQRSISARRIGTDLLPLREAVTIRVSNGATMESTRTAPPGLSQNPLAPRGFLGRGDLRQ
ncbi:MAG TPA: hypothetical protein VGL35_09395 [Rhizomicrobium sp.]|jgi:hypothetical protein